MGKPVTLKRPEPVHRLVLSNRELLIIWSALRELDAPLGLQGDKQDLLLKIERSMEGGR